MNLCLNQPPSNNFKCTWTKIRVSTIEMIESCFHTPQLILSLKSAQVQATLTSNRPSRSIEMAHIPYLLILSSKCWRYEWKGDDNGYWQDCKTEEVERPDYTNTTLIHNALGDIGASLPLSRLSIGVCDNTARGSRNAYWYMVHLNYNIFARVRYDKQQCPLNDSSSKSPHTALSDGLSNGFRWPSLGKR